MYLFVTKIFVITESAKSIVYYAGDITGYEEIDGKSCTNPYTKDGGCNGWSNVDKEVCLQVIYFISMYFIYVFVNKSRFLERTFSENKESKHFN